MTRVSLPTTASIGGFLEEFVELFLKHPALSIEMRWSNRPVDVIALGLDAAFYLTDAPDRRWVGSRVQHSVKRSTKMTVLMDLIMNLVQRFDELALGTPLAAYYQTQAALDSRHGSALDASELSLQVKSSNRKSKEQ